MIRRVSSGSAFEPEIGFCRAVRADNHVWISGTAPLAADGSCAAPGDVAGQTRRCIELAAAALAELGGDLGCVVRTRVMLVDMGRWREAARAHGEAFAAVRPACTFVQVVGFIDPAWLVELEFDAFIGA